MGTFDRNGDDVEKIRELFRAAEVTAPEAPAFLAARVLAEIKGRRHWEGRLRIWKAITAVSSVALSLAIVLSFRAENVTYSALANRPFVVRVDLVELRKQDLDYASIEIPAGVHFYSKEHPELASENKIEIALAEDVTLPNLPFVIESDEPGVKEIRVQLYSRERKLIASKEIKIHFKGEKPEAYNQEG